MKLHASFHPGSNLVYFVKINQQLLLLNVTLLDEDVAAAKASGLC